jgi:predicted acylesterase/phospholipase RssA
MAAATDLTRGGRHRARGFLPALLAAAMLASTGACAVNRRPPTTLAQLERDASTLRDVDRATRDSVIERLVRRAVKRNDRTLDVLMLSGGGQNGAFGTGFLRGWQSRPDAPMPRFDMVTGISTGALQAPYALLGTPAAMDSITATYARAATEIAPTIDWWFWLRRTGGVVNTARFDRAIEKAIDGRFRDELRTALAEDRQMLFGTADFDLGIGRAWSLGETLDTTAASLARTQKLLKAATAIPGIFPPVVIDGHVHADGGVIQNLLPLLGFDDYQRLATRLAAKGLTNVTVRVYVVMNVWSHTEPRIIDPSSRAQMNARTSGLLFYAHMPETLGALANLARAVSTEVPGLTLQLRVATMPTSLVNEPGASALFDKPFMKRIDEIGFAKARSANPWDELPSAFARPSTR